MNEKLVFRSLILGITLIILIPIACSSVVVVDTGTVGVIKNFGAVQPITLSEGIHTKRPWPLSTVMEVDIKVGTTEAEATAASKDLQGVRTKVAIQWSLTAGMAPRVIQGFGSEEALETAILSPAIQEVVKSVSARYTAEQLITKRGEVKLGVEKELAEFIKQTLAEKNALGAVRIANVAVTDFHFSKEFDAAIEAKVKAEQEALKAVNEKTKRVTQAEAAAQERRLAAEAEAFKTEVESKARADAIKRESEALSANPNLVNLRVAERWNGVLPHYTSSAIPMLQLPNNPK